MEDKLDTILVELGQLSTKVGELTIHIKGNGGKGLQQRMDDTERWIGDWEKGRPRVCPLNTEELQKRQARQIAILGVVLAVFTLVVNVVLRWWK